MARLDPSRISVLHLNAARTWRGGEQQTLYLAEGLAKAGIRQAIIGRPGSELSSRASDKGIEFIPLAMGSEADFLSAFRIATIAREGSYRILHAHTAHAHSLAILARLFFRDLRVVVTRRVDFHIRGLSGLKYRTSLVDRFCAISANVRDIMLHDGVPEDRIRLAYSGIDLKRFKKLPSSADLRKEFRIGRELVVGCVGALVDHKDQRTLIRAFGSLPEAGEKIGRGIMPRAVLVLVGDGNLKEEYEQIARDLFGVGLKARGHRIIFAGFRADIPALLSLFDIFAMSSKEEGLGTSVLDAMAAGLPLAVTDGGGLREMADPGKGALVSPARDPERLAENLTALLTQKALRDRFSAHNRRRVKDFSVEEMVKANLAVYRELV